MAHDPTVSEHNIVKFIFDQHIRLSCIIRYNNTPKLSPESVAEHSYYATFMAMLFGDYLNTHGAAVDVERLMKMSLLHDVEEIISGDIVRVLKTGGFKRELEKMNAFNMQYLTGMLGSQGDRYYELWYETKKRESAESRVMELVDIATCTVYSLKEVHMGNKFFVEILEYAIKKTLEVADQLLPIIKPLIREFADYALSYLQNDEKVCEDINRAVRLQIPHDPVDEE